MLKKHITKEEINELPLVSYEGEVVVAETNDEIFDAINEINKYNRVGFDTESRPAFKKGQYFPVSLIQIATPEKVYLLRIKDTGLTKPIADFLSNGDIEKIGVALHDDIKDLKKLAKFNDSGFIDLGKVAKSLDLVNSGARSLAGLILGFRISKSQQTSNWENETLNENQISYAATDAWVCLKIYEELIYRGYWEG
ncbi:3'-5' exonuclease [Aureibacter tunicatorum]|uniref:Ribonuclease D n=1 Tax=Aureibacter tunicatorum TaxID=866807 RepID=A0AAE3XLU0_9BACT|nr:3'-5' exonuclease [Aureibacter tunicatorum]MDR6238141.1 ribonuclease D [Aureibacter tunicatorum]BDD03174.1 3'-exoribonuclease [Aureibacter tunicatorum]